MQNQALQSGWKQLASDENEDYLYKSIRVANFSAGIKLVDSIGKAVMDAAQDKTTHLSVDASSVTISLNYPGSAKLGDNHFSLALSIDTLTGG